MKISITVTSTDDGGAYVEMDPGHTELLADIDAGRGTTAHAVALQMYVAVYQAERERAAELGRAVNAGDVPPRKH